MLALVGDHQRMDLAAIIFLGRRPQPTNIVLGVKDADPVLVGGGIVKQGFGCYEAGRPSA